MTSRIAESAEMVEISCELIHETARAFRIFDGSKDIWVPKSQCAWDPERGQPETGKAGTLLIARWFAKKEGLI